MDKWRPSEHLEPVVLVASNSVWLRPRRSAVRLCPGAPHSKALTLQLTLSATGLTANLTARGVRMASVWRAVSRCLRVWSDAHMDFCLPAAAPPNGQRGGAQYRCPRESDRTANSGAPGNDDSRVGVRSLGGVGVAPESELKTRTAPI